MSLYLLLFIVDKILFNLLSVSKFSGSTLERSGRIIILDHELTSLFSFVFFMESLAVEVRREGE